MSFLFDETDIWTQLFPTLVVIFIGQHCVNSSPEAERWGKRIASFTFFCLLGSKLLGDEVSDPFEFVELAISALLTAGMILGLSWIFLPLPFYLWRQTASEGLRTFHHWKQKQQQRENQQREEQDRLEQQRLSEEEWKRNAPERERQRREQQQLAINRADQQRRREEVRLRCQLLYDQHTQELQEKLSPQRLEAYFSQYLTDQHSAEMVEQRGELLKEMIEQSLDSDTSDQLEFNSIQEIALHFKEQRTEIEKLEYDNITRQTIQAALSTHEDSLIRAFMSRKH